MIKELKYLLFSLVIILFIFFSGKYYFSETNKKKSYRSLNTIDQKIDFYSKKLPVLENDTQNIIVMLRNQTKRKIRI